MGRKFLFETAAGRPVFELLCNAIAARANAYAPYSNYLVGCAIVTATNKVFTGCNVECVDYDGTHAEEAALAAMVVAGERNPRLLVVVGGLGDTERMSSAPPCGKCRQKIYEFASLNGTEVALVELVDDDGYRLSQISELLPRAFGPASIGIDLSKYRR